MDDCLEWLFGCRKVFPKLDKLSIRAEYKKMSYKKLGYVKGLIFQKEEIDPEVLLLEGVVKKKRKKKLRGNFTVFINENFKKVKKKNVRKQVVQSIMVHELMHIEQKDLLTLSKNYKKRKRKKIHVKDFEQEVFDRYNQLRKLKGMTIIGSKEDLDIVVGNVFEKVEMK
ncbi:MAG: hypothetical protein ISS48_00105 [Candidatus Aenigmarchaeota archaeon]|nr:hypothetical protein [Candidatus Aenigmarchaeota archaeon]